jgi:hypothetical protein
LAYIRKSWELYIVSTLSGMRWFVWDDIPHPTPPNSIPEQIKEMTAAINVWMNYL